MAVYESLVDALTDLNKRGYTTDFNLAFDHLQCAKTGECLTPSEFEITEHHRFEGISNPDDESVIYAIESKDGKMKGTLVSAYGVYSEPLNSEMIQKLSVHHS